MRRPPEDTVAVSLDHPSAPSMPPPFLSPLIRDMAIADLVQPFRASTATKLEKAILRVIKTAQELEQTEQLHATLSEAYDISAGRADLPFGQTDETLSLMDQRLGGLERTIDRLSDALTR
jgi:hypothetical protein